MPSGSVRRKGLPVLQGLLLILLAIFLAGCDGVGGGHSDVFISESDSDHTNTSPSITSAPVTGAVEGDPYTYTVTAQDADGDPLEFTLVTKPQGMQIDAGGVITWTPTASQVGIQDVEVQVDDGQGGEASQAFRIQVLAAPDRVVPFVELLAPQVVVAGGILSVVALADDDVGVEKVVFYIDGVLAGEVAAVPYRFDFNAPDQIGPPVTIRAVAIDTSGNMSEDEATVTVVLTADVTPPVINAVTAPASAAAGERITIRIDASDERGIQEVRIELGGSVVETLITPPYESILTIPGNAAAGSELVYTITVEDGSGNTATADVRITVDAISDTTPPDPVFVQAPATATPGQVVRVTAFAVDDTGILKVDFLANGTTFHVSDTPPYTADLRVPDFQPIGSQVLVTVTATDFSGNATTSDPVVIQVVAAQEAQLVGEVFDDATGLPLPDAVVRIMPVAGASLAPLPTADTRIIQVAATTQAQLSAAVADVRGHFRMSLPEGPVVIEVQRGGYTTVTRQTTLLPGVVNRVFDFRLTPIAAAVPVDPRTGTRLVLEKLGAEFQIPVGALASLIDMHVTQIGGQGLPALLPAGWTPVGAFHLGPENIVFNNPANVSLAGIATNVIAARWDAARYEWIRLGLAAVDEDQELALALPGSVVLLRPDASPVAPPIPAVGAVIEGVTPASVSAVGPAIESVTLASLPEDASAVLSPSPNVLFMQPGARAEVQLKLNTSMPLSSGTALVVDFTESYQRTDGTRLVPEVTRQDVVLYQSDDGFSGRFIASPSEVFDPALLAEGVIHLEVRSDDEVDGGVVIGSNGGTIVGSNGIVLTVPPGALTGNTPVALAASSDALDSNTAVTLTALPDLPSGLVNASDFEYIAGAEIELGSEVLATSASLHLQPGTELPAGARVLAVRVVRVNDVSRLELVGVGQVADNGVEITAGGLGLPLKGIDRSGRYYLLLSKVALGYATGLVTGGAVEAGHILAETDAAPFVSLTNSVAESYVLALPVGEGSVQATDLDNGRNAAATTVITAADDIVTLNLELGDARPTVVQVIPEDNATGVATTTSVTVRFSRTMDVSTISADNVSLQVGVDELAGTVTLLPDGVTTVFQPDKPLEKETLHTLVLAAGILDSFGEPLLGNRFDGAFTTSFSTVDLSPPARPEAGQISSTPPDDAGASIIEGTQGTVEPGAVITVQNLATGVSVSTTGKVDGSFSLTVQAGLTDNLEMLLIDPAGNQTTVELGRVTPPAGTGVIGPAGSTIQNEFGQAVLIPPGTVPEDTIISITPLELDGVVLPFSDVAPGVVGGAVTVSMPGVEIAGVMELQLSLEGVTGSTITDLVPLYAIETDIELPADLVPGTELNLRVVARDKLGEQTELVVPLPIVVADADATPRTEIVNETPVVSLTLPTQAIPGQVIHVVAKAQPPDIKVQFPADEAFTGDEQLIIYELREIAGQTFLDFADTASFKVLEDGSRIIETNSPPYRGIRRDTSQLVLAVYTNEIISFAQVVSDVTGLSGGGVAGAAVALAGSMTEQFAETIVGVSLIQAFSRPRPADVSLYEFAVVPVIGNTPTTITLVDLDTNNTLAEAQLAALPPGTFSSVVILPDDDNDPVITGTTSFKNDALPVDAGIDVIFSHKVLTDSLTNNLYIEDSSKNKVAVNLVYLPRDVGDTKAFVVKVVPEESLKSGERYTLVATTGIKRPDGKKLSSQFTLDFTAGGSGELLGSLAIKEADSFDVIGTTAVVTARSIDGTTNSLFTVDLDDPANPVVLAERKLDFRINGGLRAVRALQDVELVKRDGGLFQGDLAIVSIGSTDTFSAIRLYDITDPKDPVFLSGTLVGTPTQTIQDSASVVVIPNYDDFTDTEVFDPNQGLLDGIPDVQTIPWMIDAGGTGTAYFINNGIGLMTLDMGRAIPPPPRDERGSQLGPSYPPIHKSGALVIVDDPALVKDDGNFKITMPSSLMIISGDKIKIGGTIEGNAIAESIARILVNGFEAPIQRNEEDNKPISFGTKGDVTFEVPLYEGYNIITATAYDKTGLPLGSLQVAAGREYSSNPLGQSNEVKTDLESIQIRTANVTLMASVTDPVRFDEIFVNGESVSRKECPINVTQRTNACGWDGKGDITVPLQAGANTIMATAIDVDQNPFEGDNDREFIGLSFYDLRVVEDVAAAVYSNGLHLFQASSLARVKLLDIPNAFRLTLAPRVLTDKDADGLLGIPENDDSDQVTVFDELRNLALVGTGNLGKLVFADITEPHNAEVVGSIDFTMLAGNVKAKSVHRAAIDPEGVLAYVAAGDRIITVDITRPDEDTSGDMDARALGALPLDAMGNLKALPGAQDVRLDTERGMLYVLQKDVGLAVVAVNVCSRDAGVDATRRTVTKVSRFATLEAERGALRKGIKKALGEKECTDILPSREDVALLSQGSSACLWRKDKLCSTAYQPGLSDHDFELIVDDSLFDQAAACAEKIEEKIKAEELMKDADLSVFPVRRSVFDYAYRDVRPRGGICGGGDDPTADLCLGRNGLVLKWLLEGEWVTKNAANTDTYDGGIDLNASLKLLRSPIDKDSMKLKDGQEIPILVSGSEHSESSHIPLLEGKEWACLQDFNLNASGARIRIKSTGLGNVKIQVPAFRKQVQKGGKAGIRSVFGKMLSTAVGNNWVMGQTRDDYNAFDGCYTAIDDPDKQNKSINDFWYKRCESFEEFVASRALLSVSRGMDILSETEALQAYEFFRRKADVGTQITDEVEANEFIKSVMEFISDLQKDQGVTDIHKDTVFQFEDTTPRVENLNKCEDEHIPSYKPPENEKGGKNFKLKHPVRLFNGGYATIPATELAIFHDGTEVGTFDKDDNEIIRPPVAPLAPGASRFITLKIKATGDDKPHAVQLRLDPDDSLVEYDKANNFDGLWYYYLEDPPNTDTSVPPTAGQSQYDGAADPRPKVPDDVQLPDPLASSQCLVNDEAPESPSIELISTIDGQLEYVGQAGDMVEIEWVIRNIGNKTLNGITLNNPLLDQPIDLGTLCSESESTCSSSETVVTRQATVPAGGNTINISTVTAEDTDMNSIGVLSEFVRFREIKPDDPEIEPLIFIPGIAASKLNSGIGGGELWPAIGRPGVKQQLTLNPAEPAYLGSQVFASDIIGEDYVYGILLSELTTGFGLQRYEEEGDPGRRTFAGCDAGQKDATLFVFPYDWRKSNRETAVQLKGFVECIRTIHPDGRLNILAHSLGGLVARRFMLDVPDEISKLITIGSPWLGAPKAIHVMGTGQFFDGPIWSRLFQEALVVRRSTLRRLVGYFPGVHELLPSRNYFNLSNLTSVFPSPFENRPFSSAPPIAGGPGTPSPSSYEEFRAVFDNALFPATRPVATNEEFHDYEHPGNGRQDDWSDDKLPSSYYHVIGNGINSIGKVVTRQEVVTSLPAGAAVSLGLNSGAGLTSGGVPILNNNGFVVATNIQFVVDQQVPGDRTVPLLSAERRVARANNWNASTAELKIFTATSSSTESAVEHTGLTQFPRVHEYMHCLLAPWERTAQQCNSLKGEPAR